MAVLLIAAATLFVLVPWHDMRRLRHRLGSTEASRLQPDAARRLTAICDDYGLTGRRRPRLLLAGAPVEQAFTTAQPGRRPLVVLPAGLALPERQPDFDAVLHHELAHVLARDVTWVSTVRALTWVIIPGVALASIPGLLAAEIPTITLLPAVVPIVVTRAVILVALSAALAAALLRTRELAADRFSGDAGHAGALVTLLNAAGPPGRPPQAGWRQLIAHHPSPGARSHALLSSDVLRDAAAGQGLATGMVAAMTMGASSLILEPFLGNQIGRWPWCGSLFLHCAALVGALLLGGFVPALARRAHAARQAGVCAQWWRPVGALAVGLFVGEFISPGQPLPFETYFPAWSSGLEQNIGVAAGLAVVVASAMCVVINYLGAGLRPVLLYLTSGLFLLGVLGSLTTISQQAVRSWPDARAGAFWVLPREVWPYLMLSLPLAHLLFSVLGGSGVRFRDRRTAFLTALTGSRTMAALGAAVIAAGIASVQSRLVTASTDGARTQFAEERIWVCALVGWLVVVLFARTSGPTGFPRAVLAGWAVAAGAGAIVYLNTILRGVDHDYVWRDYLWQAESDIGATVVLAIGLTVLTAPLLVLRPARSGPPHYWMLTVHTSFASAGIAVLVLGVGLPGLYAPQPVTSTGRQPTAVTNRPLPQEAVPEVLLPADRSPTAAVILTTAELRAAAAAVQPELPSYWSARPEPASTPTSPGFPRTAPAALEPPRCRALAEVDSVPAMAARQIAVGQSRYQTLPGAALAITTTSTLRVVVRSYSVAVPVSVFSGAETATAACSRFTITHKSYVASFDVRDDPPLPSIPGARVWRVDYDLRGWAAHTPHMRGNPAGTSELILIGIGHTLIALTFTAIREPLDKHLLQAAITRTVNAVRAN
jgi:Zn-dependent protease with chaperone function